MFEEKGAQQSRLPLQVLVVGAGLGGLAAAIAISQAGHHARIVEKMPELKEVESVHTHLDFHSFG